MVKVLAFAPNQRRVRNLDIDSLGDVDVYSTTPVISQWPKRLRLEVMKSAPLPDYFSVGPLRLISANLRAVCESLDVDAEYLPITLLRTNKSKSDQDYFFCHLLGSVECFDAKSSKCSYRDKEKQVVDEVTKLVINFQKAEKSGKHLFRMEGPAFVILASDTFVERVNGTGVKGMDSIEDHEWSVTS